MQFRGPVEKGWRTDLRSEANSDDGEGSQRSGMNSLGRAKLVGDW